MCERKTFHDYSALLILRSLPVPQSKQILQ